MRILVVDDDRDIRDLLHDFLASEGYTVLQASDGLDALRVFAENHIDLIILDVMMPGLDGMEVCKRIRQSSRVPIVFLTGKDDEIDELLGFGFGADDYIVKPFSPRTLVARAKALMRRACSLSDEERSLLRFGQLKIDLSAFTVNVNGNEIEFTSKEFMLLRYFVCHPGKVLTKQQLVTGSWGEEYFGDDSSLMVHLSHIRQKLGDDASNPTWIRTVRGVGYKFTPPQEELL